MPFLPPEFHIRLQSESLRNSSSQRFLGDHGPWGANTIFILVLRCYLPFPFLFSPMCTVEFSRGYVTGNNAITLTVNGMCACIVLCYLECSKITTALGYKYVFQRLSLISILCSYQLLSFTPAINSCNLNIALHIIHSKFWSFAYASTKTQVVHFVVLFYNSTCQIFQFSKFLNCI